MKIRTWPEGPVLTHQPFSPVPIVDQIVLFTGSALGRTTTSIENRVGVQAALAGTSAYCVDPSNDAAASSSPASSPPTPRRGAFRYVPAATPRSSASVVPASSKRQYERGPSPLIETA